jgi:16S rRNA (cytidine1402-2'-O)-methyltransferase
VCRELTKLYEDTWRGAIGELAVRAATEEVRGEVTLVVAGAGAGAGQPADLDGARKDVDRLVAAGMSRSSAAREIAHRTGLPRRELFQR